MPPISPLRTRVLSFSSRLPDNARTAPSKTFASARSSSLGPSLVRPDETAAIPSLWKNQRAAPLHHRTVEALLLGIGVCMVLGILDPDIPVVLGITRALPSTPRLGNEALRHELRNQIILTFAAAYPSLNALSGKELNHVARTYLLGIARHANPNQTELDFQYRKFLAQQRRQVFASQPPELDRVVSFTLDLLSYAASLEQRGRTSEAQAYLDEARKLYSKQVPTIDQLQSHSATTSTMKILGALSNTSITARTAKILSHLLSLDFEAATRYWQRLFASAPAFPSSAEIAVLKELTVHLLWDNLDTPRLQLKWVEALLRDPRCDDIVNPLSLVPLTSRNAAPFWRMVQDAKHGSQERSNDNCLEIYANFAKTSWLLDPVLRRQLLDAYSFALRRSEEEHLFHRANLARLQQDVAFPLPAKAWEDSDPIAPYVSSIRNSSVNIDARDRMLADLIARYAAATRGHEEMHRLREILGFDFTFLDPLYPRSEGAFLELLLSELRNIEASKASQALFYSHRLLEKSI